MELRWYEVSRSINQRYCKSIIENRLLEKLESHEYDVIFACAANFLYFIAVSDHHLIPEKDNFTDDNRASIQSYKTNDHDLVFDGTQFNCLLDSVLPHNKKSIS